jgi:hypothetical protein
VFADESLELVGAILQDPTYNINMDIRACPPRPSDKVG